MPKRTKIMIIKSFELLLKKRKYESISVKQIVESCDINRKTFYYYFRDIDDLLVETFDYEILTFYQSLPEGITISEGLDLFFGFIEENKDIIYHISNSEGLENLENHFYRTLYNFANKDIIRRAKNHKLTENQIDVISNIFVHTITGFVVQWLNEGMKTDPMEFLRGLSKIIEGTLTLMMNNCDKINGTEL